MDGWISKLWFAAWSEKVDPSYQATTVLGLYCWIWIFVLSINRVNLSSYDYCHVVDERPIRMLLVRKEVVCIDTYRFVM